jgi:MFS family permease
MQQSHTLSNVRYNFVVNVIDGAFFGVGLGFASSAAVIPLFFATLTDNTALIGFVAALHMIGWSLPQMLTAQHVAKLRRYKPFVLFMTFQERMPFFGLALVAWFAPQLGNQLAMWLALLLLIWSNLGAGLSGTAWQSMIGKIMPPNRRGTFWGVQAAAANLMMSGAAIIAGLLLERLDAPLDFTLCFLFTGIAMLISMSFLAATREPESPLVRAENRPLFSWDSYRAILQKDHNFRWFLLARCLSQVASMAASFYIIYATRHLEMDEQTSGVMVGVLGLSQTVGNLLLGWIGDRWGHRKVFGLGALLLALGALVAMFAPEQNWFYLTFGLTGIANATLWATAMAMTIEFGKDHEKPLYIGISNTLMALPAIAAPIIGGWLADLAGFHVTFLVSVVGALMMAYVLLLVVRDPRTHTQPALESMIEPADVVA